MTKKNAARMMKSAAQDDEKHRADEAVLHAQQMAEELARLKAQMARLPAPPKTES